MGIVIPPPHINFYYIFGEILVTDYGGSGLSLRITDVVTDIRGEEGTEGDVGDVGGEDVVYRIGRGEVVAVERDKG